MELVPKKDKECQHYYVVDFGGLNLAGQNPEK